jgi:hypothetical protein
MKTKAVIIILLCTVITACTNSSSPQLNTPPSPSDSSIVLSIVGADIVSVVGQQINVKPVVLGASMPVFSVSPQLPIGLSINSQSGIISGISAIIQQRTRYTVSVKDALGKGAQTQVFFEARPEMFVTDTTVPEVTSVSGKAVDLTRYISGGHGSYLFSIADSSLGTVTTAGIFTPGSRRGNAVFIVTDNSGLGTVLTLSVHVGVPRLSVIYSNVPEGAPLLMALTLSGSTDVATTISYSVAITTAMPSSVSTTPGTVVIPAGSTSAQISIPTFNNNVNKDDGVFNVSLALDDNIKFANSEFTTQSFAAVVLNTVPAPEVSFSQTSSTAIEFDQTFSFDIILKGSNGSASSSTKTISVDYVLDPLFSTIEAYDSDFANGTATFLPGEMKKTISYHLYHDVNGNLPASDDRTISLKLQNPLHAVLGPAGRENILIIDPLVVVLEGTVKDFVLLDAITALGWKSAQNVLVRISSSAVLTSSSAKTAAFSSGYIKLMPPTKITILNAGLIMGRGGDGGVASDPGSAALASACNAQFAGNSGAVGGSAFSVVTPMSIVNSGSIISGGGGGGSGVSAVIGNDSLCTLSRNRVTGGLGGLGADAGLSDPHVMTQGSQISPSDGVGAPYASGGAAGGAPGKPGHPGIAPMSFLAPVSPGLGGAAGKVFDDLDPVSGGHYITLTQTATGSILGN